MSHASPKTVVVVGGGVVGLMCAYYLRRLGAEVVVVERDRVGRGCSWGNLGWICPSISVPLPAPGLGVRSLSSMLDVDSPLYIRPSAAPKLARWLLLFRAHCNAADYRTGSAAFRALNASTMHLFDELAGEGVEFERAQAGLTFVSTDPSALDEEREQIESFGIGAVEEWSAHRLYEREPALGDSFVGALHVETDGHVRSDTVCEGVRRALVSEGAHVHEGFGVVEVVQDRGRVVSVRGSQGSIDCDAVVVAAGAETGRLTLPLGYRLPLQAGKGYSLSILDPRVRLNSPLYLCDQKVGLTPYEGMLRIGGTMELSGLNRTLDRKRIDSIRRVVSKVIPDAFEGSSVEEWVGMRPLTPDGLPVIGRIPGSANGFVATGHQMLGVTLAPATGHALAHLILGGTPGADLAPFDPERYA